MLAALVLGLALGISLAPGVNTVLLSWFSKTIPVGAAPSWPTVSSEVLCVMALSAIATVLLGGTALAIWHRRSPLAPLPLRLALTLMMVLPAMTWAIARAPSPGPLDVARLAPRRFIALKAVIVTPPARTEDGWRTRLAVTASSSFPIGKRTGLMDASLPNGPRPGVGTLWAIAGHLDNPQGPRNPGESDRAARLARQSVFATFNAERARCLGSPRGWGAARALDALRMRLLTGLGSGLTPARSALLGSLVLGTGASPVDPTLADHFRSIGLSHLLAASGAQVGMLSAVGYAGALALGLTPAWAAALTLPGLILYL
jgi:hypothetical protein